MNSSGKIRWKHQRLNNGCAWTCLAMLLSRWGIDIETEQLIAESIIPYLIEYSTIDKSFRAGMLVQHTDVFNSITQPYGLEHIDKRFSDWAAYRKKAMHLLQEGIPFMTSIAVEFIPLPAYDKFRKSGVESHGHAVVIFGCDEEGFHGLDPDGGLDRSRLYQFDSVKDKVQFRITSDNLRKGLEQKPGRSFLIGWHRAVEPEQGPDMSDYLRRSRESVTVFRNRMNAFNEEINSSADLSYETFMERVYSLIKPIALDLRAAIETIDPKSECQRKLSDELLKLRIMIQEHQSNYGSDNLPNLPEITERICTLLTEHIESYLIL